MPDSSFNHVGLCVADLARSQRFYEEAFGFTVLRHMEIPDAPADRLLQVSTPLGLSVTYLQRDGLVLELLHYRRDGNPPARARVLNEPGLTHLSLTVDDLAAACASVQEQGGEVLSATDVVAAVFVRDPDGQLIELMKRRV